MISAGEVQKIKPQISEMIDSDYLNCYQLHPKSKSYEERNSMGVSKFCEIGLDARMHGDEYVEMALSNSGLDHGNITVARWGSYATEILYSGPVKLNGKWRWVSVRDDDTNGKLDCGDHVIINCGLDKGYGDALCTFNYPVCDDSYPEMTKQVEAAYQKALEWIGFI